MFLVVLKHVFESFGEDFIVHRGIRFVGLLVIDVTVGKRDVIHVVCVLLLLDRLRDKGGMLDGVGRGEGALVVPTLERGDRWLSEGGFGGGVWGEWKEMV